MNMIEQEGIRGRLQLKVFRHDKLIETFCQDNFIVNNGKQFLARLLAGLSAEKISFVGVGNDGAAPEENQAELKNGIYVPITQTQPSSTGIAFSFQIDENTANGIAIREFGLFGNQGTLFARKVRESALFKDRTLRLEGVWTINF